MRTSVGRPLVAIALAACASMRAAASPGTDGGGAAAALLALDRQWTDAEVRGDRAAAAALVTDDFTQTNSRGVVQGRAEYLSGVVAPSPAFSFREVGDRYRVRVYGAAAVMTHRATVTEVRNGSVTEFRLQVTHLWVRQHGRWRVAAHHQSRIAP